MPVRMPRQKRGLLDLLNRYAGLLTLVQFIIDILRGLKILQFHEGLGNGPSNLDSVDFCLSS